MNKPTINIELDREKGSYFPGDVVHAEISLNSDKSITLREVYAQLLGPEYVGTEILIGEKIEIQAGLNTTCNVDFLIPLYPKPEIGFDVSQESGKNLHILFGSPWKIEVSSRHELLASECLSLVVPPPGLFSDPIECKFVGLADASNKQANLGLYKVKNVRLWLPRLEWIEGEVIEGKLNLIPEKDGAIKGLKIKLSRCAWEYISHIKAYQVTGEDAEVVLFEDERFFHAGESSEYTFALPIKKRGWPTRYTSHDYVQSQIVITIGRGFFQQKEVTCLVYIYDGKGNRSTEHIQPGTSDALFADERVFQFYKNTAREWYSGESPVFIAMQPGFYGPACTAPVAKLGDEFLRDYQPFGMVPLNKFFAQVRPEMDEFLISVIFDNEHGGYVLTNYRFFVISLSRMYNFTGQANTKVYNLSEISSFENKIFPPKITIKMKNGEVYEEKVLAPDFMKTLLSVS